MRPEPRDRSTDFNTSNPALPGQWLYYFIGVMGGIIALFLWYAAIRQSNTNLNHIIELEAEHVTNDIKIQLELRISALKHMAKHLEEGPELYQTNWQNNIIEFVNNYGEFKAIALLDDNLKTLLSYPNQTLSYSPLFNQITDQYRNNLKSLSDSQAWISSPIPDKVGSQNIFIVVAFQNRLNHQNNYLISMLNLPDALNSQLINADYRVAIYINNDPAYTNYTVLSNSVIAPKVMLFDMYDSQWKITVIPSAHLLSAVKTNLPNIALLLGISIAILFIVASRLSQLARQRAKSLDKMYQNLKIEIMERQEAEESKLNLEKQLLQGQKLQAIGTLAGGIAHDFNNLLYAIIGYVEMAREDVEKDQLVYNNLGKVLEASHRGQELIARLLAFSRRQHHELQPISIKSTIESVLALLKPTIPASVTIDFINELIEDFMILGDQTRLHQVILNIINNAVDAMDAEGVITIKLSQLTLDNELLQQFPGIQAGKYCKIELSDTGHGMDQRTIARIFEPFFTTKEVGKGTGLGLAMAHTTVKEHHGEIFVESRLGHGTTFILLLPEYKIGA